MSAPAWQSAAQIAERWERVSVYRVGQTVRMLGLCGSVRHVRAVDGRNEYSPYAVGLIERELRSRGYSRGGIGIACREGLGDPFDPAPMEIARIDEFQNWVADGTWTPAKALVQELLDEVKRCRRADLQNPATECSSCGGFRSSGESPGTGDYIDDEGAAAWLCLACWCVVNYGAGSRESLDARIDAKRRDAGSNS